MALLLKPAQARRRCRMSESKKPEPPQFPAGPFVPSETHGADDLEVWIDEVERAPARLRDAVSV
jgi:hypothetical protein